MKPYRIAIAAAVCLAPIVGNATTYRLDGVYNGSPDAIGSVTIDDSVVESGSIDISRSCKMANACESVSSGWDKVSFDLSAGSLQDAVTGTGGSYDTADFHVRFDEFGNVSGGSLKIEGDHAPYPAGGQTTLLDISGVGSTFSGFYVPSDLGGDRDFTLTFVREGPPVGEPGGRRHPIPEPHFGLPLLFGGGIVLALLAGGTKPRLVRPGTPPPA